MNTPGLASMMRAGAKLEDGSGATTAGARAWWRGWCFEAAAAALAVSASAAVMAIAGKYFMPIAPIPDMLPKGSTHREDLRSRSDQFRAACMLGLLFAIVSPDTLAEEHGARPMSVVGTTRTSQDVCVMSALAVPAQTVDA